MAAAAAADSAAGTLHAPAPLPNLSATHAAVPTHALAAPPTGQASAQPGTSAVANAGPGALGPAQGLLGSLTTPQPVPASSVNAAAAAQLTSQAPSALQGAAPPLRATAGEPLQRGGAMQNGAMPSAGKPPAFGSQAMGTHDLSSSAPILGTGLPSMPQHGSKQPDSTHRGGAAGGPEGLHVVPPPPDVTQSVMASSQASIAAGLPLSHVQPHIAAVMPPKSQHPGQPPASVSLSSMVEQPASSNGAHAESPAVASTASQGASEHPARASLQPSAASQQESRLQHTQETAQKSQSAPGHVHEAERSCLQKPNKLSESSLLEVQADSSGKALPDAHGGVNGHHHCEHSRTFPSGVCEQGALRERASKEREHAEARAWPCCIQGSPA